MNDCSMNEQDLAVMKAVDQIANYNSFDYTKINRFPGELQENDDDGAVPVRRYIAFQIDIIHIITLTLAFLLFVSFIIIFIQASKLNCELFIKFLILIIKFFFYS